jgi:transmembrane sensor
MHEGIMNIQIYEEASEWIIRHRDGTLDSDSRQHFDQWLRESPQHIRAYLEMASIWEVVSELDPNHIAAADELIAHACQDSNVFRLGLSTSSAVPPARRAPILALVASIFLAFGIGITTWYFVYRTPTYTTDIGEQRSITLSDGSSVQLNARSRVRIRYSDQERAIDLVQGQALFRVAKDSNKPFIVESNGSQVRAVGTQFDVYQKSTGTVVTVVEGRVTVLATAPDVHGGSSDDAGSNFPASPGAGTANLTGQSNTARPQAGGAPSLRLGNDVQVLLTAGEQLLIAQAAAPTEPTPANIDAATAWTRQRLVFDFSPLTEVAEEFNRYNRIPLVIDDPSLQAFHVSGSFSSTDSTLLLRFLRAQHELAVSETEREIRISRKKAGAR